MLYKKSTNKQAQNPNNVFLKSNIHTPIPMNKLYSNHFLFKIIMILYKLLNLSGPESPYMTNERVKLDHIFSTLLGQVTTVFSTYISLRIWPMLWPFLQKMLTPHICSNFLDPLRLIHGQASVNHSLRNPAQMIYKVLFISKHVSVILLYNPVNTF